MPCPSSYREWLSQNTHLSPVSFSGAFSLCCIVLVEIMWLKSNIGSHSHDVGQYYTESAHEQFFAIPKSALCWGSTGLSWSHYGQHFLKDVHRDEDKWLMKVANRTKRGRDLSSYDQRKRWGESNLQRHECSEKIVKVKLLMRKG